MWPCECHLGSIRFTLKRALGRGKIRHERFSKVGNFLERSLSQDSSPTEKRRSNPLPACFSRSGLSGHCRSAGSKEPHLSPRFRSSSYCNNSCFDIARCDLVKRPAGQRFLPIPPDSSSIVGREGGRSTPAGDPRLLSYYSPRGWSVYSFAPYLRSNSAMSVLPCLVAKRRAVSPPLSLAFTSAP